MRKLITIFAILELRRKILITLLFLVIYRIGYAIPLPMVDQEKLAKKMAEQSGGTMGQMLGLVSTFSGGPRLGRASLKRMAFIVARAEILLDGSMISRSGSC